MFAFVLLSGGLPRIRSWLVYGQSARESAVSGEQSGRSIISAGDVLIGRQLR
jgi:hypothetical protein